MKTVDVMDYWKPEDDTEEDRRQGIRHIGPATQRAIDEIVRLGGGNVVIPDGRVSRQSTTLPNDKSA